MRLWRPCLCDLSTTTAPAVRGTRTDHHKDPCDRHRCEAGRGFSERTAGRRTRRHQEAVGPCAHRRDRDGVRPKSDVIDLFGNALRDPAQHSTQPDDDSDEPSLRAVPPSADVAVNYWRQRLRGLLEKIQQASEAYPDASICDCSRQSPSSHFKAHPPIATRDPRNEP